MDSPRRDLYFELYSRGVHLHFRDSDLRKREATGRLLYVGTGRAGSRIRLGKTPGLAFAFSHGVSKVLFDKSYSYHRFINIFETEIYDDLTLDNVTKRGGT